MWLSALLLVLALGGLAVLIWRGQKQYALFKTYTETRDRQRYYRRMLVGSAVIFGGGALAALALTGQFEAVRTLPPAFGGFSSALQGEMPPGEFLHSSALLGLAIGLSIGLTGLAVMTRLRRGKPSQMAVGDILPLIPRNGAETVYGAFLSLNAGISEELFFRLLIPLLIASLTGSAAAGILIGGVVFGLAHVYQGWIGVVATTVIGFLLTAIYLWSGQLWIAMAVHAAFDLVGLVIRPTISRALARRGR